MAGVINKSARLYTIRQFHPEQSDKILNVRLAPGFNNIDDEVWSMIKDNAFIIDLKSKDEIEFDTDRAMDMEIEESPSTSLEPVNIEEVKKPRRKRRKKTENTDD